MLSPQSRDRETGSAVSVRFGFGYQALSFGHRALSIGGDASIEVLGKTTFWGEDALPAEIRESRAASKAASGLSFAIGTPGADIGMEESANTDHGSDGKRYSVATGVR